MNHYWRVMAPTHEPVGKRCMHGKKRGECIKNSHCQLRKQPPSLWKWLAEFRYKKDAQKYAKQFEGAQIVEDEII